MANIPIDDPPATAPLVQQTPTETEEERKLQEAQEEKQNQLDKDLKEEAHDDKVYKALENFLLADPKRQIPDLKGSVGQEEEAAKARKEGSKMIARGKYETAAKIEIYNQDMEKARKYISLADEVTDDGYHHELHRTLLSNMDEVFRISEEYYEKLLSSAPKERIDTSNERI